MTRRGLQVALQSDNSLPAFTSQNAAERFLFQLRDDFRAEILQLAAQCDVRLDFSPDSLKTLESWYFDLRGSDGFDQLGVTQGQFERCIGYYTCFVYTARDPNFTWIVKESPLVNGKFYLAVTNGLMTIAVSHHSRTIDLRNNKRMESNYREYKKLAGL